jgi:periplasmic protein CpxP/Spy
MKRCHLTVVLMPLLTTGILCAQQNFHGQFSPGVQQATRPATLENMLGGGLSGKWWTMPRVIQRLGLTPDQLKKMEDVFQQSRLKLIDLTAALDKEEAVLGPLVEADQPDAPKIRAQIDRIAQARAELEKANANMLLGIRLILTPEQWKDRPGPGRGRLGRGMPVSPDDSPAAAPVPKKKQL